MRKLLLTFFIALAAATAAPQAEATSPRGPQKERDQREQRETRDREGRETREARERDEASNPEREQWMAEIRQYKRAYFAKELDLSREQQQKFFPLYEEMGQKITDVTDDARTMERRIDEADDASDTEYQKATEVLYDAKAQEAQIEKDYAERFRDILTPRQLFRLKSVERQFSRDLMRQHQRLRATKKKS